MVATANLSIPLTVEVDPQPAPRLDNERDVIWLAGLFEGEATFDLHRGKYPRVRIGMTDRDVIGRAATLMGCKVTSRYHEAPNQATWHAEISGDKAERVMAAVLPYMGARRSGRIATILGHAGSARRPKPTRPPGLPL
jgi:hypothetical protein